MQAMKFSVEGRTLRAVGTLEPEDLAEFESACNYLANTSNEHSLLLDLTQVNHMASLYVGVLLSLRRRLADQGRRLALRPSFVVRQLLELSGEGGFIADSNGAKIDSHFRSSFFSTWRGLVMRG